MEYSATEFETLYIQCFPPSMRLAMNLLHEEDEARDVVQEVFLKLWESNTRVENPMAFIIRTVRNTCLNRISLLDTRNRIRQRIMLDSTIEDFDIDKRNDEVRQVIHELLTPREQDVVDRIYGEGMSYKDAAENLDISVATINKNVVSALKKLRDHFKTH